MDVKELKIKKTTASNGKSAEKKIPEATQNTTETKKELTPEEILQEEKKKKIGEAAYEGMLGPNPVVGISRKSIFDTLQMMGMQMIKQPFLTLRHQTNFWAEMIEIVKGSSELAPEKKDSRFDDPSWQYNWVYNRVLKTYLAIRKEWNEWIEESELDDFDTQRAKFIMALFTEAFAPSNYAFNPSAVKRFLETGGLSAVKGFQNALDDMVNNNGMPSMVDKKVFAVGKNLAITPGSVVFRNELIELIQYKPMTEKVKEIPFMVVPPQINKFYTFDLSPNKSLAKYLLMHGIQTFIVSWRNPTVQHKDWSLQTYLDALEEAMDAIQEITGQEKVNIAGACSGGITVSTLLGNLAQQGNQRINSTTLMVSVLDTHTTSENGTPLGLFATDEAIETARKHSAKSGVLKGDDMAKVFSWMRPNDLIWNYWVNNYLHGNQPPAFDVLYWNCDTTQLPAKFHSELLDLFKENPLTKSGAVKVAGIPVDLSKIKSDMYFVAGITDHITPWEACYRSSRFFSNSKIEFILSNSGHIQSILNPPGNPKASYFKNGKRPANPKEWYNEASLVEGSWWDDWSKWLAARSGEDKDAPKVLGNEKHKPIVDSPGTYVFA